MGFLKMSQPLTDMLPDVAEIHPVRIFMVVDFPAPLGPKKP
jgi:hypothetical protein